MYMFAGMRSPGAPQRHRLPPVPLSPDLPQPNQVHCRRHPRLPGRLRGRCWPDHRWRNAPSRPAVLGVRPLPGVPDLWCPVKRRKPVAWLDVQPMGGEGQAAGWLLPNGSVPPATRQSRLGHATYDPGRGVLGSGMVPALEVMAQDTAFARG